MITCMKCDVWQRDGMDGICRRNAPKSIIAPKGVYSIVWPRTRADEGCGEGIPLSLEVQSETQRNYT